MSPMPGFILTKLLLIAFLCSVPVTSTSYPWWSLYNTCAWPSLDAAVPLACSTDVGLAVTQCLCTSSDFLINAAKGIGAACGCSILDQTSTTAAAICKSFGFPIAIDSGEMVAAGQACNNNVASSSVSNTPTKAASTVTVTPTSSVGSNTPSKTVSNTADTIESMTASTAVSNTAASTPTSSSSGSGSSNKWSTYLAPALSVGTFLLAVLGFWFKCHKHKAKKKMNGYQTYNRDAYTPLGPLTKGPFQTDLRRIV